MMRFSWFVLPLVLVGCAGDTGGERVGFTAVARRVADTPTWDDDGWHVTLSEAACAVGPVYLWSGASRAQGGVANDFEYGFVRGEVTAQAAIDLLVDDDVVLGEGEAIAGEARSAELWLAPPEGDVANALDGAGFRVAGTVEPVGGAPLRFAGTLTLDDALFTDPSMTAAEQRKVRGIPLAADDAGPATLTEGGTLVISVDPRAWLEGVDWASVEALPEDEDGIRQLLPGGSAHATWLRGVRQAEGPWTLVWSP